MIRLRVVLALSCVVVLASCSSTPPAAVTCDQGFTACGNACVKVEEDTAHCGACGNACGTAKACVEGACYAEDCTGTDCSASQVCPVDRCVERACLGVVCPATEACFQGECVASACGTLTCATGLVCVNGSCEDTSCYGVMCPTGSLCELGLCEASTCADGRRGGDETDVDCGGSCPGCTFGGACGASADCLSQACTNGACTYASTCSNSMKDGTESDVDCGGGCRPCPDGKACVAPADCYSAECTASRCTSSAQCADGIKNNSETGVDCGGNCPALCAVGGGCVVNGDCASGVCSAGTCGQGTTCTNTMKDGQETDVDCGGPTCTARCSDAKSCLANTDCASGRCSAAMVCVSPGCTDGIKNGPETGIDCGGGCPNRCPAGSACLTAADCADAVCLSNICAAPTCADGYANGTESDVDCGGTCTDKCIQAERCNTNGDCLSALCLNNRCTGDPTCSDSVLNQGEVDVDCGGANCPPCANGKQCNVATDCTNLFCSGTPKTCSGGFLPGATVPNGGGTTFAVGRFNNDAYADTVMFSNGTMLSMFGSSAGTFSVPSSTVQPLAPRAGRAGRVNADTLDDVIVINNNSGGVAVLLSNGDGSFQSPISTTAPNRTMQDFATGDVNGDGKLDLVVGARDPSNVPRLVIMLGTGLGTFTVGVDLPLAAGMAGNNVVVVETADIDNDGKLDALVATNTPSLLQPFFGNGAGAFTAAPTLAIPDGYAGGVGAGDFNKDGSADIVVTLASQPIYEFHTFYGTGAGGFLPPVTRTLSLYAGAVYVADYNGDTNLDFITFTSDPVLMLGDGLGGFRTGQTPTTVPWFQTGTIQMGDVNGDGKQDIVRMGSLCCPVNYSIYLAE